MTKEKFEKMLKSHDWHFERSDDHSKWRQGIEEQKQIFAAKRILGSVGQELFDEYRKKHHP